MLNPKQLRCLTYWDGLCSYQANTRAYTYTALVYPHVETWPVCQYGTPMGKDNVVHFKEFRRELLDGLVR